MSLMVSISGIRGIVGDSLIPEIIVKYTAAFAEYCDRGKIVLGRDGRVSGKIVGNIVSSTLLAAGCDVIALGVAPTPTIQIAVEQLHAGGGISVTASHNPIEWNGLKFIGRSGMFLDGEENRKFWSLAGTNRIAYMPWNQLGKHTNDDSFLRQHVDMLLNLPYINIDAIRARKFKIVVDCINASGGVIVPQLLHMLGCDVVEMNCDVGGIFVRTPEPVPENLGALMTRVPAEEADLGIAVDPDVDRLVLIDEQGKPFGEEYTVASVVDFILRRERGRTHTSPAVVVNLSTTRAVDDIAGMYGAKVFRTPVGEINVAKRMKEVGALVGGEGSGGVILPAVHYGRDAIVGIGLILQALTDYGGGASDYKAALPQYAIAKQKVQVETGHADAVMAKIRNHHARSGRMNVEDGLKFDFPSSWVHLRKSNTEPIIRIIAEAPAMSEAEALVRRFTQEILEA